MDKDSISRALSYNLVDSSKDGGFSELAFSFIENDKGEWVRKYTEKEARDLGYWTFKDPMPSDEVIDNAYKKFLEQDKKFKENLLEKKENYSRVKELLSNKKAFDALDKLINKG